MRNQIFHSPGNEEAELAKIPGDGDPPPPHWDLYSYPQKTTKFSTFFALASKNGQIKKIKVPYGPK